MRAQLLNLSSLTTCITKAERLAIQQLRNNKQIVINKADKGSTIVVVNRDDYIEDGLKHLDNPSVYRKLKTDATHLTHHKILSFLSTLKIQRWMPWQFSKYCTPPTDYHTSQLYFLENISSFVDGWLNPLVQKLPSYIKDSMEFIKLVTSTRIPTDSILVSIDVSSLYTNIPHRDGIAACTQALKAETDLDPARNPKHCTKKQCD
jgi:hypothetical protein